MSVIAPDYLGSGETVIPAELKYVEVIAVTAKSGYDANTQEQEEEKELPSTVTVLVRPEQSRLLARLEAEEKSICHWYTGETARKLHSSLKHRIWCWRSFWKKPQRKKRYLL